MTTRIPWLSISGISGRNIVPGLGAALLGVTFTDNEGEESDTLTIRLSAKPGAIAAPKRGKRYSFAAGWRNGAGSLSGVFAVETIGFSGSPDDGDTMDVVCRAADFIDKMKQAETRHYDTENGFGTFGKIIEKLAADAGVTAAIAPELAALEMPYRLRHNQSAIDFAADLADEVGAVIKPQAGRLVVRPRGAATSVSGGALATLMVDRENTYSYDFDIDPRPAHKESEAGWFDPASGRLKAAVETINAQASRMALAHPAPDEAQAKRSAKAQAKRLNQASGLGSVSMQGDAAATGGAPTRLSGFGGMVDGLSWRIATATHEISPAEGWITKVSLETEG